jgi:hypothetical protein
VSAKHVVFALAVFAVTVPIVQASEVPPGTGPKVGDLKGNVIEVAKAFGRGRCRFHDLDEWAAIQRRYGSMAHLMTPGRE